MAVRIPIEEVLAKFPDAKLEGNHYRHKGPEQSDWINPSLIFREAAPGWTYFYDFSQPDRTELETCKALGFDIHPGLCDRDNVGPHDIAYIYYPMEEPVPVTVKWLHPKRFKQWHIKDGKYIPNMEGVERRLYNLPALREANLNEIIFLVEGEKDADNLGEIGIVATTFMGGAGHHENTKNIEVLRNRRIAIYPDNDNVGKKHAWQIAKRLEGIAKEIKILNNLLPDQPHSDITDWLLKDTKTKSSTPPPIETLKPFLIAIYEATEKLTPSVAEETARAQGFDKQYDQTAMCVLSRNDPSKSAEKMEQMKFTETTERNDRIITYRNYQDSPIIFSKKDGSWNFVTRSFVFNIIWKFLEVAKQAIPSKRTADVHMLAAGFEGLEYIDFMPKKNDAEEIFFALQNRNFFQLPAGVALPYWLTADPDPVNNPRPSPQNIIVTKSGILDITDLDHIHLRPVTPELLNFATLGIEVDPNNPPPYPNEWFEWLKDWFQDDDAIRHSAKWSTLLARPDISHKKELYLRGQGNSGKTTWLYYIMRMLGERNYLSSSIHQLGDEFGLADAPGKLAIIIDDAQYESARNLGLFLQRRRSISGGTPVQIRRMRQEAFSLLLSARLIYASDDLPRMTDSGDQDEIRRSVLRFMFDVRKTKKKLLKMDVHRKKIDKMLSSIFWHYTLQLGERALREDQELINPKNTEIILDEIRWDTQPYIKFLESEFEESDEYKTLIIDAFERWQQFCSVNSLDDKSRGDQKTFTRNFCKNAGVERIRRGHVWYFSKIRLRPVNKQPSDTQNESKPSGEM